MSRAPARATQVARAGVVVAGAAALVAVCALIAVAVLGVSGVQVGRQFVVAAAAAGAAVILLSPVQRRLAALVGSVAGLGGSRPEAALERFTSRLGPPIGPEELLLQLAEALKRSLRASRAEVWILEADRLQRRVSVPHLGEGDLIAVEARERRQLANPNVYGISWTEVWLPELLDGRGSCSLRVAPVVNEGQPLGLLAVERSPADDFAMAEEAVLGELARHLAVSLHNERLRVALEATLADVRRANEDLRASRARIVEAADAERRRIERDLHDGAQQQLIAVSIELQRARGALGGDLAEAASRLDQADAALAEATEELVDLAHGIYPPVLRDSGLAVALRGAARRHPSPVRLQAAGLGRHPAAVEAAIYFAVVEALQNAAKHASGADVAVTLGEHDGDVLFEVSDEGPGFDPEAARGGHGVLNIRDRIGAIGGIAEWESSPASGTRLHGSVPSRGEPPR